MCGVFDSLVNTATQQLFQSPAAQSPITHLLRLEGRTTLLTPGGGKGNCVFTDGCRVSGEEAQEVSWISGSVSCSASVYVFV
ncbi:hypothetical protein KOW79_002136 [Hemibagrus wyckioides]|uniref:Uncharacterized protein n=1 Tax=Hemibagrus wyckioides TaxID=337641 RepID=A0A9D3P444_9TELE|nr:hypothetical protein KOW79_002136 [Hemibagrus wyckioides]